MANPIDIEILENVVTKVADNVFTGFINRHWRDKRDLFYYSTYRLTGDPAPTLEEMYSEMKRIFVETGKEEQEPIQSSVAIDVYLIAAKEDGNIDTGLVVVAV